MARRIEKESNKRSEIELHNKNRAKQQKSVAQAT